MQPSFESLQCYGVSRESYEQLNLYFLLLNKWQKAINLVSPKSLPDAWVRHFVDSVQLLKFLPEGDLKVADFGSGGGFAGLVVAIGRPDIHMNLIDSDMRKCQFLKTVSRESSLNNVTVHNDRVENVMSAVSPDLITARGFAPVLNIFDAVFECGMSFSDLDFVLLKGERYAEEVAEAQEKYNFDCTVSMSDTDDHGHILSIKNVNKLSL